MKQQIAWLAVFCLSLPGAALARGVSGSERMLCAVTEVLECPFEEACIRQTAEGIALPAFLVIDPKAKMLLEYQGERKTPVQTVYERDGHVVLQGYEKRAWSISISKETGRASVAATEADVGLVIFGVCTDL